MQLNIPNSILPFFESVTPLTGAATYTGVQKDSGPLTTTTPGFTPEPAPNAVKQYVAQAVSDQAGTLKIQNSEVGGAGTWYDAATVSMLAGIPVSISTFCTSRYYRTVLINGATPQTSVYIGSGFVR